MIVILCKLHSVILVKVKAFSILVDFLVTVIEAMVFLQIHDKEISSC